MLDAVSGEVLKEEALRLAVSDELAIDDVS
jgi:hypothetical protein